MSETLLTRVPREELSDGARMAWDALNELTGTPTFVDVFAQAPELLDFAMVQFYQNIFFDGRVEEKYKQLSRLRLSMNHGFRTCNLQNLIGVGSIGYSQDQAIEQNTSYQVYNASKELSQTKRATEGYGNNGGEEFLSFLQTGESMVINNDNDWKTWFDNTSGKLLAIQNKDGSWNGHHCITSPVFCTATCLLTLSINNDIEELTAVGKK